MQVKKQEFSKIIKGSWGILCHIEIYDIKNIFRILNNIWQVEEFANKKKNWYYDSRFKKEKNLIPLLYLQTVYKWLEQKNHKHSIPSSEVLTIEK